MVLKTNSHSPLQLPHCAVKWFSRQHQKCIWKVDRRQWLGLCWCDSGLWGWSSHGSPKGDLGRLQTTNNHPHPLLLAGGFLLLSKIFLPRQGGQRKWGEDTSDLILMRNRGQDLGWQEKKKTFLNLENQERKEKVFY